MKKYALTLCSILLFLGSTYANNDEKLAEFNNKLNDNTISFQENKGQVCDQNYHSRPDVLFSGQSQVLVYHLKNNGISYQLSRIDSYKEVEDERTKEKRKEIDQSTIYRIDVNWLNANTAAPVIKGEALQGYNNYYLASCPEGALNVKSYQNITYQNVYDGIDLKWYSKAGELKYDYLVAPGADYTNIKLEIKGAESIQINKKGELEIKTPLGILIEKAPYVEQDGKELRSAWKILKDHTISFEIDNPNSKLQLIIDPAVRVWGTYFGSTSSEEGGSCAVDVNGMVYLGGYTQSGSGIATTGSYQVSYRGGYDAFLAQFNSAGVRQWATYYGGTGNDWVRSCVVDAADKIYLAGTTTSTTLIATAGSHKSTHGGGTYDAFLVKFNSAGLRQWGTYYGGSNSDEGNSCAVDTSGNVYLVGTTISTNGIATAGSHQNTIFGGQYDAFLVKFDSTGVRQWGTYYGETENDYGYSCAVDVFGKVYLAGQANSINGIVTTGSHQNVFGGGFSDAFLVQFDSTGVRQWATYYGGNGYEIGKSCVVDAFGNVYLLGDTESISGIATAGSHQSTHGGGTYDAFLVQFNSAGVRQWGTYYGGSNSDNGYSCAVNTLGQVYLIGITNSTNGIATIGSHQSAIGGIKDAFMVKFNSSGIRQWGTYYGGTQIDYVNSCAVDVSDKVYLAGETSSNNAIATAGSHQSTYSTNIDVFLVQFEDCYVVNYDIQTACDSFTWIDGNIYTSSTNSPTFTIAGAGSNGCDSVVILNLTILNSSISIDVQTACNSITWLDGNTYISSTNTPTFTIAGGAVNGCDSVITLNFNYNPVTSTDIQTACNSITWIDGNTYTASTNTPTYTLTNSVGCDSIITLNLTINNLTSSYTSLDNGNGNYTFTNTSTGSFNQTHWAFGDGTTSTAANPNHTFSANGTYVVVLTVNDSTNGSCSDYYLDTIVVTGVVAPLQCAAGFVLYPDAGGVTVVNSSTGTNLTYLWSFGDGDTSTLQTPTHTYAASGPYYLCLTIDDGAGCVDMYCDSIGENGVVFNKQTGFTINVIAPPLATQVNEQATITSVVAIYPNPTTAEFIIELANYSPETQLNIVSVEGKIVYTNNTINANKIVINAADWSKGIYMVKITDKQSSQVVKLVKQ